MRSQESPQYKSWSTRRFVAYLTLILVPAVIGILVYVEWGVFPVVVGIIFCFVCYVGGKLLQADGNDNTPGKARKR